MPSSDTSRKQKALSGNNESGFSEAFVRFSQKSHAGDYAGLIVLAVLYTLLKIFAEPWHRSFSLDDHRIQHPYAEHERVPVVWLFIYAVIIPTALLSLWSLILRPDLHKTHVTLLGLVITIVTTLFLTDLFKDAIGRPRPDLIARCKPELDTPRNELVTIDVCTETNHHVLHDGWRSYPSGHSSFAFAGLGWLSLVLASQLQVLRPRGNMAAVLLCMAPLIGAALIAISRLEDYRHDVGDVVTGSALGFAVAYLNWCRYYPSLFAENCHDPYPIVYGSGRWSPSGFQRVRDEEENYVSDRHMPEDEERRY